MTDDYLLKIARKCWPSLEIGSAKMFDGVLTAYDKLGGYLRSTVINNWEPGDCQEFRELKSDLEDLDFDLAEGYIDESDYRDQVDEIARKIGRLWFDEVLQSMDETL